MSYFDQAIEKFDALNNQDPNKVTFEGQETPKEFLYAKRMSEKLQDFFPEASEILKLAARCQHICRWKIPRNQYPQGTQNYKKWRNDLTQLHVEIASNVLKEVGYDTETILRVQALLKKEKLKSDPEAQILEDVVCLVFLEDYFAEFSRDHNSEKLVKILKKVWKKMSPQGHQAALELKFPSELREIIEKAVN